MAEKRGFDDLAAELEAISFVASGLCSLIDGNTASEETIYNVSFAIARYLERLSDDVAELG